MLKGNAYPIYRRLILSESSIKLINDILNYKGFKNCIILQISICEISDTKNCIIVYEKTTKCYTNSINVVFYLEKDLASNKIYQTISLEDYKRYMLNNKLKKLKV